MSQTLRLTLTALAVTVCGAAFAESEPEHPMIDFHRLATTESLEGVKTVQLKIQRAAYAAALSESENIPTDTARLEAQLLEALLHYDAERIRIVELIPQMIEHYQVDAELADDMMRFRETIDGVIKELRPNITTLQRYKPYDFRIGFSYMSLMNTLQHHANVRDRMAADYKDESTFLGQYQRNLRDRYEGVAEARGHLERSYQVADITTQLDRIDTELARRQGL